MEQWKAAIAQSIKILDPKISFIPRILYSKVSTLGVFHKETSRSFPSDEPPTDGYSTFVKNLRSYFYFGASSRRTEADTSAWRAVTMRK
jgi:hypothetical protein